MINRIWIIIFLVIMLTMLFCNKKTETEVNYTYTVHTINSPFSCTYAIIKDNQNCDHETVLYYLHGAGGNELTWIQKHKKLIKYWKDRKKPIPIVVSITFGDRWILFPKNSSKSSGSLDFFVNEFMPLVENQINTSIKKRYLFGISMGGQSAAQLVFRYPTLFSKAAIISPFLYPISIYSSREEIDNYIEEVKKNSFGLHYWINYYLFGKDTIKNTILNMMNNQKKYLPDIKSWDQADIINNMANPPAKNIPRIYISCSKNDENGFYFGTIKLYEKARIHSYPVNLTILDGSHNAAINEKEIADFFIND